MNKIAYLQGYMEKTASPALIKAYRKGLISREVLEAAVKKLKLKPRFVEDLGQGFEGVAELHTNPRRGFHVEKVHDPESPLFSEKLHKEKRKINATMIDDPRFADYYGKKKAGLPVTKHEYVREGGEIPFDSGATDIRGDISGRDTPFLRETNLNKYLMSRGLSPVRDTYMNHGNVINGRVIDFIPTNTEESVNYYKWIEALKKAESTGDTGLVSHYNNRVVKAEDYPDITPAVDIKRRAYNYEQHG